MAPQLPLFKLAFALIKQIHRPTSAWISRRAKRSEFFRSRICMPPAQFYHWCEVKMKMWVMNLGRPVEIPKLNEQMAIELGANLLGEGIIFSIAAAILTAEYVRQVKKEAGKEQAKQEAFQELSDRIRDLEMETIRQDAQIRELNRLCISLQGKPLEEPEASAAVADPPTNQPAQVVETKQVPPSVVTTVNLQTEAPAASVGQQGLVKTALSFIRMN